MLAVAPPDPYCASVLNTFHESSGVNFYSFFRIILEEPKQGELPSVCHLFKAQFAHLPVKGEYFPVKLIAGGKNLRDGYGRRGKFFDIGIGLVTLFLSVRRDRKHKKKQRN